MKHGNSKHIPGGDLVLLSEEDLEVLIYMTSDVWITPEVIRFKNMILGRLKP
jgi:hypothetical protein